MASLSACAIRRKLVVTGGIRRAYEPLVEKEIDDLAYRNYTRVVIHSFICWLLARCRPGSFIASAWQDLRIVIIIGRHPGGPLCAPCLPIEVQHRNGRTSG